MFNICRSWQLEFNYYTMYSPRLATQVLLLRMVRNDAAPLYPIDLAAATSDELF